MNYTAEEVREAAATNEHPIPLRVRDMLTAYADSLERAQGGVTDGVVDVAHDTIFGHPSFDIGENGFLGKPAVRAGLLAVWPNPPAQAAQSEDWRIAFFERWHEAAQGKGYVGIAAAITAVPAAEVVAQGEASLGRCKACGRATRAVCDGLDGNGLGCTNAPPIDLAAVREVIESHINEAKKLRHDPESQDYLYEQADKLEAVLQELKP
jgi:hypothetical protein